MTISSASNSNSASPIAPHRVGVADRAAGMADAGDRSEVLERLVGRPLGRTSRALSTSANRWRRRVFRRRCHDQHLAAGGPALP